MSRKTEKVVLWGILTRFYFCEFRWEEFFNTYSDYTHNLRARLPTVADPLVRSVSCTSFLIRAARLVQSFGLDGANRTQSVGESSELFRVSLLRL
jgi:hypothetical protein